MQQESKSVRKLTGRFELLHPSKYLKAADLQDKDVTVVIADVTEEDLVMQGGKRDRKPAIHMRSRGGRPLGKKMLLNKTNAKLIAATTGEKLVERWVGKEITIYATTTKGARGETMDCIRVRARVNQRADEIPEEMAREPEPEPAFVDEAEASEGTDACGATS